MMEVAGADYAVIRNQVSMKANAREVVKKQKL